MYESGTASIIGYGGARGGAKSHGGRELMLIRRWKYANTPCFIIRKTLDDLRDNHIRPMLKEHPMLSDWYNKQEKVITLPNGSWIRFISSDNYDDIFKLYGKEAADIFVDQSEQFSQEQLEFLTTINRCTSNIDITPKMLWTFNPGNIGHAYHRRVFIDKDFEGNEHPQEFAFLQAYGWDNVEWVRKSLLRDKISVTNFYTWDSDKRFSYFISESDYGRKLDRLPDSQRKAQLLGDWDVFEGQFLSMWRRDLHIVPPMTEIPQEFNRAGVIDYGERTVLLCGFRDFEGRIVTFAECYSEAQTPQERFLAMADMLTERGLHKLLIYCDTNMYLDLKNYTGYDKTQEQIAQEVFRAKMGDNAPILLKVSKATTDKRGYRVVCNEAVKSALYWRKDNGTLTERPKTVVTSDCKMLIKTAPLLLHDPDSVDGLDFVQGKAIDDPYDAWKMLLMALHTPYAEVKVQPKTPEELLEYLYPTEEYV